MAERNLPLHVFHFDCFWMKAFQWCDFEWDPLTFPDPEGMIRRLKAKVITPVEMYAYIGLLTALRVSHDSSDKRLSSKVETYPLNQSQISIFTEDLLKLTEEKKTLTAWDIYNVATEIYKPGRTDIPAMIPQNGALAELMLSEGLPES